MLITSFYRTDGFSIHNPFIAKNYFEHLKNADDDTIIFGRIWNPTIHVTWRDADGNITGGSYEDAQEFMSREVVF